MSAAFTQSAGEPNFIRPLQGIRILPAAALLLHLVGALITGRVERTFADRSMQHRLLAAALFKTALFSTAAVVASGFDVRVHAPSGGLNAITS